MAEFYYIDLYFDPEEHSFCNLILECVSSLMEAGCSLKKVVIPTADSLTSTPGKGVSDTYGIEHIHSLCTQHRKAMEKKMEPFISFPPSWGRIVLKHEFALDHELREDVYEEEAETNTGFGDIGLSFRYTASLAYGRKIKLTMSLWNDYLLSNGSAETHIENVRSLIMIIESMSKFAMPYFGVMNNELHIDIDSAHERLLKGTVPEGNEFAIIGPGHIHWLNTGALDTSCIPYWKLQSGLTLIQFTDRWDGKFVF